MASKTPKKNNTALFQRRCTLLLRTEQKRLRNGVFQARSTSEHPIIAQAVGIIAQAVGITAQTVGIIAQTVGKPCVFPLAHMGMGRLSSSGINARENGAQRGDGYAVSPLF